MSGRGREDRKADGLDRAGGFQFHCRRGKMGESNGKSSKAQRNNSRTRCRTAAAALPNSSRAMPAARLSRQLLNAASIRNSQAWFIAAGIMLLSLPVVPAQSVVKAAPILPG